MPEAVLHSSTGIPLLTLHFLRGNEMMASGLSPVVLTWEEGWEELGDTAGQTRACRRQGASTREGALHPNCLVPESAPKSVRREKEEMKDWRQVGRRHPGKGKTSPAAHGASLLVHRDTVG